MSSLRHNALWVETSPSNSDSTAVPVVILEGNSFPFLSCSSGLTALRSDEVIDLMIKEYPTKHSEYSVILQERERQRIAKEYSVSSQATKKDPVEVGPRYFHLKCNENLLHTSPNIFLTFLFFHSKCNSRTLRRWRPAKSPST